MAVTWYWKHKLGEIHYKVTEGKEKGSSWKLEMFGGNMMVAFIYRYKKDGEKFYNFFCWFNDIEHAKRVLKDSPDFFDNISAIPSKCKKIKICVTSKEYKFSNKEMLKFAQLLAKNKYKVELY